MKFLICSVRKFINSPQFGIIRFFISARATGWRSFFFRICVNATPCSTRLSCEIAIPSDRLWSIFFQFYWSPFRQIICQARNENTALRTRLRENSPIDCLSPGSDPTPPPRYSLMEVTVHDLLYMLHHRVCLRYLSHLHHEHKCITSKLITGAVKH